MLQLIFSDQTNIHTLHRGAFCQIPFRWIYYYGSNESTRKETGTMHLCALCCRLACKGRNLRLFPYQLFPLNMNKSNRDILLCIIICKTMFHKAIYKQQHIFLMQFFLQDNMNEIILFH